jgi:hypothetical protein
MAMPCSTEESDCIGHVGDAMNDLSQRYSGTVELQINGRLLGFWR